MYLDVKIFLDKVIDKLNEPIALEIENILAEMSTYEIVTVFNRKQVKEEAEKIRFTLGQMQDMFNDYGIQVFNTETKALEIATIHTATTADLLSVIKYYEDNFTSIAKENTEEQERIIRIDERIKTFKSAQAVWGFNFQIPIAENESLLERLKYEQTHNPLATDEGEKDNGK